MKRLLIIAFHYPPYFGSSGILRTLKFSQYLPENGWECIVLTASLRAYAQSEADARKGAIPVPPGVSVVRTFAIDAANDLRFFGYYPSLAALPDRWISWWPSAVLAGRRIIRSLRPAAIFSTYPIATAHLIASTLHRGSGIPWVADFRDSMTEENYPSDPRRRGMYRRIERRAVAQAARVIFTARGTETMYRERYPAVAAERWLTIPNGYDEEMLGRLAAAVPRPAARERITLLHAGVLYPHERDPREFFRAIAAMKSNGSISSASLRIVLRATGHDDVIAPMLAEAQIGDIVELAASIPYEAALREMFEVDGLLVFQAANSNHQVPAKTYEYMRTGRPVLAVTDPRGDTAELLRSAGVDSIVRIDDARDIERGLQLFIQGIRGGNAPVVPLEVAQRYSRRAQAQMLAGVLNDVARSARGSGRG